MNAVRIAATFALVVCGIVSCTPSEGAQNDSGFTVGDIAETKNLRQKLAAFYRSPEELLQGLSPATPQYELPLDLNRVVNGNDLQQALRSEKARSLLRKNGFAVADAGRNDDVKAFYKSIKQQGLPVFITTDSLLHLYHIQFDETLKGIEEREFYDDALAMSRALVEHLTEKEKGLEGKSARAARTCVAYAGVALRLLGDDANLPEYARSEVEEEVALIQAHSGFSQSPVFGYKEDYSQYKPRGHYTRSEKLKRYFRALMWYGRLTFLLKGGDDALISKEQARIQTLAASMLASLLDEVKLSDGRTVAEVWQRMYTVTAYYVGFADDLTPLDYRSALQDVFGNEWTLSQWQDNENYFELRKQLAEMRAPQIYGGTGDVGGPPVNIANEQDLMEALEKTRGMRLMGQRYIPDSYIMGQLVYPTVGSYQGNDPAFTTVSMPGGPGRGFPRGLDVMAVLGSERARAHLRKLGDDNYERYDATLKKLTEKFSGVQRKEWNRNLYWSWLYALKSLLGTKSDGYPTFMQTDAWQDKQLNAALGSWAQLRHDTILYAKQSYTMRATAMPAPEKMVEGYVEPVPEFYARLWALTDMTQRGLDSMNVLDEKASRRLEALKGIIRRLLEISKQELENKKLSQSDYGFIRNFADAVERAVAGVNQQGLETTIVADVHTDTNSGQVLEEGTGYLRMVAAAYPMPDGGIVVGFGPAFSYYEFKQPMSQRLTDEEWKKMLRSDPPALPRWVDSFSVTD